MPYRRRPRVVRFDYSLIAIAACAYAGSAQAASVTWTSNASDSWTNAADWSSSPALPGPADDVTINQPSPITVTLSSGNQSIHSLIDDNTLVVSAGTLAVVNTLQVNGNLTMSGGTLQNATLSTAGAGAITVTSGTFDRVTLASNLSISGVNYFFTQDGLTLSNSTLSLSNTSSLNVLGNESFGGSGTVEFDGTGTEYISSNSTATLTNGANVTIQTGTGSAIIEPKSLINQGIISAQTSGTTITIEPTTFTNTGTIQALNGGIIAILSNLTTAQLGTFNSTGGTIKMFGVLDNSNSTLVLDGVGNTLYGATIKNGTISTANGATFSGSATFDGVRLSSNLTLPNATLIVMDGLTLSNSTLSLGYIMYIQGTETLAGNGIIEFDGTGTKSISTPGGLWTLTTGANVTIQTGTGSGSIDISGFINQGLISAQTSGKSITISSPTFTNTGTLQALNGGTITISSNITTASLGTFNSTGGTINISGTLDNSNSTLALNGVGNSLTLLNGTIKNGILSFANGAALTLSGSSYFDHVTLASNFSLSDNTLFIENSLILSNSTLSLNNASTLYVVTGGSFSGLGTIEFDGTGIETIIPGALSLTVGANVTIQTGTGSGNISTGGLINQGIISAQTSGKTITISPAKFTNTGTLQALNGGTLTIYSNLASSALGTFNSTGGTINISGTLDNTASTLALNGIGNSLTLLNGTIKNGTLSIANGAQLTVSSGTLSVPSVNVAAGGILHQSAGTVTISSLSQTGGTISLGGTSQTLYAIPTISITGGTTTLTTDALKVLTTTALTFGGSSGAWTGELDLTQNKLIVEATSATKSTMLAALRDQVLFGRTNAAGILSSTIAANFAIAVVDNSVLNRSTFGGQPVDPNSILIAPELLGDTNIDGHVDLTDLNTVLNNLGTVNANWTSGNFDNAATIDLNDLNDVLNNLGSSYANANSVLAAEALLQATPSPTPEPASLTLLALGAVALLHCRRNKTA